MEHNNLTLVNYLANLIYIREMHEKGVRTAYWSSLEPRLQQHYLDKAFHLYQEWKREEIEFTKKEKSLIR